MDVISSYDDESKELIIFGRRVCLDPDWVRGIESDVRGGRGHMSSHLHVVGLVQ